MPPLQINKSVTTHVSHAKRFSNVVDFSGGVWIISFSPITRQLTVDYADDTDLIDKTTQP
jgi:hypothetical protein